MLDKKRTSYWFPQRTNILESVRPWNRPIQLFDSDVRQRNCRHTILRGGAHLYIRISARVCMIYILYIYILYICIYLYILYICIYPYGWKRERERKRECEGLCVGLLTEGWRWCWKEIESIPIGPLWYSEATMPAIGRRSTKPLNDPPRRSRCATATLFQSRKSSCFPPPFPPSSPYLAFSLASILDAKLPHFSVLTRLADISTIARMVMQSRVVSDVSYTMTGDSRSLDVSREFSRAFMDIAARFYEIFTNYFLLRIVSIHSAIYSGKKFTSLLFNIF